jgi:Ca2+-binding RTX toxin-like protein
LRAARRAALAAGLALAGAAVAAGPGSAAVHAHTSPPYKMSKLKAPKIKHGVLTVEGTNDDDTITLRLVAGSPGKLQVDGGAVAFTFDRSSFDAIEVDAGKGDDTVRIDESNGVFTDTIPTTIGGGEGNDTLIGGSGRETFDGGDGNDFVDGNRGNDVASLGAGDDTFQWDPGDGSDTIEGQGGTDTMVFNGANVAEKIDLSANGNRLRFTRDVASITMDTAGVEQVDFNALGGADTVTVNNLAGTDVNSVSVDLAASGGGGDGSADAVVVNGTAGDDSVRVDPIAAGVTARGLAATVSVLHPDAGDRLAVNGLDGKNRVDVNGTAGDDTLTVAGDPSEITVAGLPALVSIPTPAAGDTLSVNGLGGNDRLDATALQAQPAALVLDGGDGDDTIAGSQGVETSIGGNGNDVVDGNRGNDVALLGAGDDTFVWDPGDGSDTVEGQAGSDTMRFNGANIAERIDLSANGPRLRFTRDVASITMDTAGVERVDFNALGGADTVTVHDLTGTGVTDVDVDLAATGGGGDGAADEVVAEGTAGADAVTVAGDGSGVTATGLPARVSVLHPEATDRLTVNGLAGADRFTVNGTAGADSLALAGDATGVVVTGLPAIVAIAQTEQADQVVVQGLDGDDSISGVGQASQPAKLTIDGGAGNDTITGTQGVDTLIGGDGNDFVDGNRGNDVALMGAGDDTFQWDPGDGSDVVEGEAGADRMVFNGANIAEQVELSANGSRLRFTRDIASITMDTAGVERVDFHALGGADKVTVDDLTGTDVKQVDVDLGSSAGTGDGAVDQVVVEATNGGDVVHVAGDAAGVAVTGLAAAISIVHAEPTDQLRVDGRDGDDVIEAAGLTADALSLTIDGGVGDDVLIGGAGNDTILGGAGDDVLTGGPGQDTLDGGPGSNTVIQD